MHTFVHRLAEVISLLSRSIDLKSEMTALRIDWTFS